MAENNINCELILAQNALKLLNGRLEEKVAERTAALLMEIEERKSTEIALKATAERLNKIFISAPLSIMTLETDGRIVSWNPASERIFGWSAEEAIGQLFQCVMDERKAEHNLSFSSVLSGDTLTDIELEKTRKDGTPITISLSTSSIHNESGLTTGILVFAADITKRKRAEEAHEHLLLAIEQSAEAIVITDTEGTIQYVNPAFETTSGYLREEAVGQNPRILKSGEQNGEFYENLWKTLTGGNTWEGRLINKRKNGSLFTEETTISPVSSADGAIVNYVAVKRDITEQLRMYTEKERLEEQLRQAQKMEAVGRLAGGIAHDFNNMLAVINGYAGMAVDSLKPGDPLLSDLKEILKAGERSAILTRQLLAFSRRQPLAPVIFDINNTIKGVEPMLRRLIGEDIDFIAFYDDKLGYVKADPGQIEQVIMNLVVNSRDAMTMGGKLTIETGNVELDEEYASNHQDVTPGQYVMLSITDTGCGFDKSVQERIFEPFFTTKEKGKGTGLGLSTVFGIVMQSGGHIWVYSEPGKGTTFKIYLRRELSAIEASAHDNKKESLTTGTETILVVEDEQGVLNLTKRVLEASGYKVHTAANGGEALLICEREGDSLHLMITDIVMPEMSGRVLSERLSTICPNMKVIYMSGYTDDAIVHHGILEQGINFISKPFTILGLTAKVRMVLDA